jgi:hypothetical protein
MKQKYHKVLFLYKYKIQSLTYTYNFFRIDTKFLVIYCWQVVPDNYPLIPTSAELMRVGKAKELLILPQKKDRNKEIHKSKDKVNRTQNIYEAAFGIQPIKTELGKMGRKEEKCDDDSLIAIFKKLGLSIEY